MKLTASSAVLPLAGAVMMAWSASARATEDGNSINLLGIRVPGAGLQPPPGLFLQNDGYFYFGSVAGNVALPRGGQIAVGVKSNIQFESPTLLWVTSAKLLGGDLAFTFTEPIGFTQTHAHVGGLAKSDHLSAFADPVVGAQIGWSKEDLHWQAGARVGVPIGDYRKGALGNVSLHRWVGDVWAGVTYLNPKSGLDVSGLVGVTFNGTNHVTDYKSGTEFHSEAAIVQHFSKSVDAGIVGYWYKQISGDSGRGAILGPFKGHTAAIGATLGYNFNAGKLPISTRIKYVHEFDEWHRLHGQAAFLTIAVPLWVAHH